MPAIRASADLRNKYSEISVDDPPKIDRRQTCLFNLF